MSLSERQARRFIRALLPDRAARLDGDAFRLERSGVTLDLPRKMANGLAELGVVIIGGGLCRPGPRAEAWLGAKSAAEPAALVDLGESPLARLATTIGDDGAPFLQPHHVEAGERLRRLVERARMSQRVTMSYEDRGRPGRSGGRNIAPDLADSALDARRKLAEIAAILPDECGGVVFDVCGLLKGLQAVETERRWPRRSAKLVLRIGLDQLARHFGLSPMATGKPGPSRAWLPERLPLDF